MNQLVITSDGSHTIYVPELNEHYHSIHGAVQESEFIFIKNGFVFCEADPINIFEVGFGTGLNALLTAVKSEEGSRKVNYTTIEKYPLAELVYNDLNHHNFAGKEGKELFYRLHRSPWNTGVNICSNFNLKKVEEDIISYSFTEQYDLIYFDAFGPDKQPVLWSREIFEKIVTHMNRKGVFVTYSAKGEVKRNLRACGLDVMLLPGPPGKRQITRAIKN